MGDYNFVHTIEFNLLQTDCVSMTVYQSRTRYIDSYQTRWFVAGPLSALTSAERVKNYGILLDWNLDVSQSTLIAPNQLWREQERKEKRKNSQEKVG